MILNVFCEIVYLIYKVQMYKFIPMIFFTSKKIGEGYLT
jgi:hypothetical protein